MKEAICNWFEKNRHCENGMFTTTDLKALEGNLQVKWWKQCGTLIVKTVKLKKEWRGKGLFTQMCHGIMDQYSDINALCLESVMDETLMWKLEQSGWARREGTTNFYLVH